MHTSHSSDIARRRIKPTGEPHSCNGSIAVPRGESQAPRRIKRELHATKISRQAQPQRFDRSLLVRPPNKKSVASACFPHGCQGHALLRREIPFRDIDGMRKVAYLLDINPNGVVRSEE